MVLWRYANAVVLDPKTHRAAPHGREDLQFQGPILRSELEAVAEQIRQNLFDGGQMRVDRTKRRNDFEVGAALTNFALEQQQHLVDSILEPNGRRRYLFTSQAAVLEQIVQQRIHVFGRASDPAGIIDAIWAHP